MPERTRRPRPQTRVAKPCPRTIGTTMAHRAASRLYTIDDVADRLRLSARTVRRLVASGSLSAHRFGRLVRISDTDLATFLAAKRSI